MCSPRVHCAQLTARKVQRTIDALGNASVPPSAGILRLRILSRSASKKGVRVRARLTSGNCFIESSEKHDVTPFFLRLQTGIGRPISWRTSSEPQRPVSPSPQNDSGRRRLFQFGKMKQRQKQNNKTERTIPRSWNARTDRSRLAVSDSLHYPQAAPAASFRHDFISALHIASTSAGSSDTPFSERRTRLLWRHLAAQEICRLSPDHTRTSGIAVAVSLRCKRLCLLRERTRLEPHRTASRSGISTI